MHVNLNFYKNLLEKYPIFTKISTSGIMFTLSDLTVQKFTRKKPEDKWDWKRTARMSFFGFFIYGPFLPGYLWSLERISAAIVNPVSKINPLVKLALDQTGGSTIICSMFSIWNSIGQGHSLPEAGNQLRKEYFQLVYNSIISFFFF